MRKRHKWVLAEIDESEDVEFFEGITRADTGLTEEELEQIDEIWELEDDWDMEYIEVNSEDSQQTP